MVDTVIIHPYQVFRSDEAGHSWRRQRRANRRVGKGIAGFDSRATCCAAPDVLTKDSLVRRDGRQANEAATSGMTIGGELMRSLCPVH